jgi:hypothetical protein
LQHASHISIPYQNNRLPVYQIRQKPYTITNMQILLRVYKTNFVLH